MAHEAKDMSGAVAAYKAARASGKGTADACRAAMAAGATMQEATDMSWQIETGALAPQWTDASGRETHASKAFYRGVARKARGY